VSSPSRAREGAFTLIEMLAVVTLTAIVLGVAIDVYIDLSNASARAADQTRVARRAAVILDRVSQDLEATVLVRKPDEVDPLEHPWVFLAESYQSSEGADHLKFVRRGRRRGDVETTDSDLEMVAWVTEPTERDDLELRRWSIPQLPEGLDRSFPRSEATQLVASGLASFGVRFLSPTGDWTDNWDSSTISQSGELPVAAEITVSLYVDDEDAQTSPPYTRRLILPMRPLDLERQLDQNGTGASNGKDDQRDEENADATCPVGKTVGECLQLLGSPPELLALKQQYGISDEQCAADFQGVDSRLDAVLPVCLQ
jgi:type II secretion system protein J